MSVRGSLTATLPRLRRPIAMALTSLIGMLTLGVIIPTTVATYAYAANIGSAPQTYNSKTGVVEICNRDLKPVTFTNNIDHLLHFGVVFSFACAWGSYNPGTPVRVVEHAEFQASNSQYFADSCQIFCIGTNRTGYSGSTYTSSDSNGCNELGTGLSSRSYTWSLPNRQEKGTSCIDEGTTHQTGWESFSGTVRYFENNLTNIPTSGNETSCTCGTFTGTTSLVATQVGSSVTSNGSIPPFPSDYFADGTAPDADPGTSACSRTLTDTNAMTGAFSASRTGMVNATATQAVFAWGDATTNTTVTGAGPWQANHTYGAISTQPTNGWTEVTTFTVTSNSGHVFSNGSTTFTGTCSLRVDFLNPNAQTAGGTGGASTGDANGGDTGLDSCIPSGWNIINPVALIGGIGCMLKKLFIPTSATSTSLNSMWTGITSKAPFSVLYEVVTFVPQNLDDFVFAVNAYSPVVSHGIGGPNTSPICASDNANTTHTQLGLCDYSGAYPFEGGGPFRVDGGTGHVTDPNVYLVRQIALFALGLLFFYACYRGVGEILK